MEPIEANFLTHRIDLLVKLDGRVGPRFDREAMRRAMTYRPLAEVEAELKSEPSLTTAAITLWPSFLTRLPLLPDSIDLDIIYLGE